MKITADAGHCYPKTRDRAITAENNNARIEREGSMEALKDIARRVLYPVPADLKKRQTKPSSIEALKASIEANFFSGWRDKGTVSAEAYAADFRAHLHERLDIDRKTMVPWLNTICPLHGARILEVGCGTGSSTVALAEQGAHVTALDIDADANRVARDRCKLHGVKARIIDGNIDTFDLADRYDMVIFVACVEHMTIKERLASLRRVWSHLRKGELLVVVETPNRLWWFDDHTGSLPFYNWLPNALAFEYSRFSPRQSFNARYRSPTPDSIEHFLRQGRGVSFHEFDAAIGSYGVRSGMRQWQGWRYSLRQSSCDRAYKRFLRRVAPSLHPDWLEPYLNLALAKT